MKRNNSINKRKGARDGATAIEYALILSLLVLALIAGVSAAGESTKQQFEKTHNSYPE